VGLTSLVKPETVLHFLNVYLNSLKSFCWHSLQIEVLATVLHEPGCNSRIIMGDFNIISPEDHTLFDKHKLVDAWVVLHRRIRSGGAI